MPEATASAPAPAEARGRASLRERRRGGLSLPELWFVLAVLLPLVAALGARMRTGDLAYQLRAGEIMLRTHSVLRADTFTFTVPGRAWLNQQWAAEALFALLFRAGGWLALALMRAALVGLVAFLVLRACRAAGASKKWSAWLAIAGFLVAATEGGSFALRPQLVAAALFGATLVLLAEREAPDRRLWAIPVLVAVWANVHGSFFLGPLVVGLAWLDARHRRSPRASTLFRVGLISVVATLVNPFGLGAWRYVVSLSTNPDVGRFISEWQPPTLRQPSGIAFFGSFAVVALFLARRKGVPWPRLLWFGAFFTLGLFAERAIIWWALAAPVALADLVPNTEAAEGVERPRPVNAVLVVVVALVGAWFVTQWWGLDRISPPETRVADAPVGIAYELRTSLPPGARIFAAEGGAWFEFALPSDRVFVDSRVELFPSWVWDQYWAIVSARQGWQDLLVRWRVDAVVVGPGDGPLLSRISHDPGWRLAYRDADGYVFLPVA